MNTFVQLDYKILVVRVMLYRQTSGFKKSAAVVTKMFNLDSAPLGKGHRECWYRSCLAATITWHQLSIGDAFKGRDHSVLVLLVSTIVTRTSDKGRIKSFIRRHENHHRCWHQWRATLLAEDNHRSIRGIRRRKRHLMLRGLIWEM